MFISSGLIAYSMLRNSYVFHPSARPNMLQYDLVQFGWLQSVRVRDGLRQHCTTNQVGKLTKTSYSMPE